MNEEIQFEFQISDYQYTTIEDYYDDWLMVTLSIQSLAGKSVKLKSPCLMTSELIQMKK
ncbi:WapI family immunity protein [Paenibacillus wulumuqiensis]